MAHRSSASALHTARVILKDYVLEVKPVEVLPSGRIPILLNTEGHVSVIIDYATNAFKLAELRPELKYWQRHLRVKDASAGQIANFLRKMLTVFEMIPQDGSDHTPVLSKFIIPTEFNTGNVVKQLSKAARETSRFIFFYYYVKPKQGIQDEAIDKHNIARLAEVSLGLPRTLKLIPIIKNQLKRLTDETASEIEVRKCMREVGVIMEYLPNYGSQEEETKLLI